MSKCLSKNNNAGQTLIETMVAVFMLVMGVSAAVGLAVYALNSSSNISKQIIATGLAREGVEAIKNMRDTNWLVSTLDTTCYDYSNAGANYASCHKLWLNPGGVGYNISSQPASTISLRLNANNAAGLWTLQSATNNWGLDFDSNLSCGSGFCGFYGVSNLATGSLDGNSEYYRQIVITEDTSGPYSQAEFHRLQVESRVWWTDRKCPRVQDWSQTIPTCRIAIDTNLTNWKDY